MTLIEIKRFNPDYAIEELGAENAYFVIRSTERAEC